MAAPMLAVAAWIWASAARMSGRRRRSSAGRAIGTSGGTGGISAAGPSSFRSAAGGWPSRTLSAVDGLLGLALQQGDGGGGRGHQGVGVGHVEGAHEPGL